MNKKGFTLIELLATIVIMALILIMVMPSIRALRNNSEKKQYEYYGDSLIEAAKIFVNKEGEDITSLGTLNFIGCVDITYQELIDADLIEPFTEENIDCSNALIRYTKERKKESYSINLTCKDTTTGKTVYSVNDISNDTCTVAMADDKTPPTCGSTTGESTTWTKDNRTITVNCVDNQGKCENVTKTFDKTTKVGNITIKDANGNKTTCPVNVYVDKTAPTCTSSGGSDSWTTSAVNITGTCSDNDSGCATPTINKNYNSEGSWSKQSPGIVKDNVGNTTQCPSNQSIKIDRSVPTPYIKNITNERAPMVCNYTKEQMEEGLYVPIQCTLYAYDPPYGFSQKFSVDDKGGSGIKDELSYYVAFGGSTCKDPGNDGTFPWGQWNTNAWGNYGISHCSSAEYYIRYRDNVGNVSETLTMWIYYGN